MLKQYNAQLKAESDLELIRDIIKKERFTDTYKTRRAS